LEMGYSLQREIREGWFRVNGSGHIKDPKSGQWGTYGGSIGRGAVKVKAGGTGTEDYWCRSSDYVLCNVSSLFTTISKSVISY